MECQLKIHCGSAGRAEVVLPYIGGMKACIFCVAEEEGLTPERVLQDAEAWNSRFSGIRLINENDEMESEEEECANCGRNFSTWKPRMKWKRTLCRITRFWYLLWHAGRKATPWGLPGPPAKFKACISRRYGGMQARRFYQDSTVGDGGRVDLSDCLRRVCVDRPGADCFCGDKKGRRLDSYEGIYSATVARL